MTKQVEPTTEYRCPGEKYAISRAVHLGRLARFYPGCRQCPHRDDTGTLSARQVRQLVETRPRGEVRPVFHDEGAGGVFGNDLRPEVVRELAAAFGVWKAKGEGRRAEEDATNSPPVVVLAGDGRPLVAELVAAASEGLRWAGCDVVDIGPASAACVAFAVDLVRREVAPPCIHEFAPPCIHGGLNGVHGGLNGGHGGILVGNPGGGPHRVGLKFWNGDGRPLSGGGSLEPLIDVYQAGFDRPTRVYGRLQRFQAAGPYLATLEPYYHALRPLRLVLDSACRPVAEYLATLIGPVACRIIPARTTRADLPRRVREDGADFAAWVADDGEVCEVLDERGRAVPTEQLLVALARQLLAEHRQATIVLEEGTAPGVVQEVEAAGGRIIQSGPRRAAIAAAMREHGALFGGGSSRRFWYTAAGLPLPDGLMTITLLLVLLSRSDRPLSAVLDRGLSAN